MRRAIYAGVALGAVGGLLFVQHDALRLTTAWPAVLGFALWETAGRRGARATVAAAAALVGAFAGFLTYAAVAQLLPLTDLSVGIAAGLAVGVLVLVGVAAGERMPLAGLLMGYGAFVGMFQPLWAESPGAIRSEGIATLSVAVLAMVAGLVAAAAVRALTDRAERVTPVPMPERRITTGIDADGRLVTGGGVR